MDSKEYQLLDATDLTRLIKKKEVSSEELLDAAFARMKEVNKELNAVIRTRKATVYQEAKSSKSAPFSGVPILLKDISQSIKGEVLSSGSKLLKQNIAANDSNFVARLKQIGFLPIGHTNTPEFGLKNVTEPEAYGATRNPWNLDHSPGGSSGGAAAAVSAGIVPVAGASDGGGSIRIPASFTGLFGLKPTRGRTPVGPGVGRQWQGASIDFVLTKSVRDSAALLDYLQTVQPEAAFQTPLFEGSYFNVVKEWNNQKLRVGFTTESPVGTSVSEEAKQAVTQVVQWLEKEGHDVEMCRIPVDGYQLMHHYYKMNAGEMNRVITGLEKALQRELTSHDMDPFTWVLHQSGKNISAANYSESLIGWDKAAEQMMEYHKKYDLLITPTNAHPAPKIGELTPSAYELERLLMVNEQSALEQQQLVYDMFLPSLTYTPFTQLANLTGQPAISMPVYVTDHHLPMGVHAMSPKGREDLLFQLAAQLEQSDLWIRTDQHLN
ncbi:6-aminohexanoate-cyclic-dimer hydrolase [Paraliobacillus sp. PM-2]|uniref:amidase n=1 Tax=Paraliobacillus sp. PM-2 TaxID=1462524 RepID=UPI00061BE4D2|nr:amidase [Paraliobacillus sp. PM-2]CQR46008.1 6-aminohexanoate-cyclic-dimer hydrolase [Paraliobacillus sp. PM-2]